MHESKNMKRTHGIHADQVRMWHLLHEVLTEIALVQPIVVVIPLTLVHAVSLRYP